jgi:esterase/lipase superfamily enzyme
MEIERLYRLAGLALLAVGSLTGPVMARIDAPAPPKASLLELTLSPGGSENPPGDRLVATVLIYPGTDGVDLELEAEAVDAAARRMMPTSGGAPVPGDGTPEKPPTTRRIRAGDAAHRGPGGRFRLTATARRPGAAAAVVQVPLVVPRSAIELTPEDRRIRYIFRGSINGTEAFSTATRAISPSATLRTPRTPAPADFPAAAPVEVLIPSPDAPAPGGDRMPPVPGKLTPGPAAPAKTVPAAPAPRQPDFLPLPPPVPGGGFGGGGTRGPVSIPENAPAAPAIVLADRSFTVLPKRSVLFATNRALSGRPGPPSHRFGDAVDSQIRYGSCLVNIPVEQHIQGQLELPTWYSGDNPNRFFLIDATTLLELPEFRSVIAGRGAESRREILVYVHGFNTPFDFAVMRLAQVVHDIEFGGTPVVFSWPSHGSPYRYDDDEANALNSVEALAEALRTLVDIQAGRPEDLRGKVHVIAHSLGNRLTLRALEALNSELAAGRKPFGQVILAAPDVSVAEFTQQVPAAQARADRVTLYFCPVDEALLASQVRHPYEPRAGRGVVPIRALDNIDARKANTSFLGHGYWADAKQLLIDMQLLVNLGWGPDLRPITLQPMIASPSYPYWTFR